MHDDDDLGRHPEPAPTFDRPTLASSCARAATAAELRYRVPYPNSLPRVSRIVALDPGAAAVMAATREEPWKGARFLSLGRQPDISPNEVTLVGPEGGERLASEELDGADLVVMVATSSAAAREAEIIGRLARERSVMTAGIVVAGRDGDDVVAAMRPTCSVLVMAADADYLPAMLTALRA